MKPSNLLVIMSDEHNPKLMGCAGHPMVKTPNLDRLAGEGTRFTAGYTNSPICVPARASFATGQYVHRIRYWDNAIPYDGRIASWGHRLMESGNRVVSIGKLHYRSEMDPVGFDEEIAPMHVINGIGDLTGLIRKDPPVRKRSRKYIEEARSGDSTYIQYDKDIREQTLSWLQNEAPKYQDKPWVLFVSFVCPHFPLVAPPEFWDLYPPESVPWPINNVPGKAPDHPGIQEYWRLNDYSTPFTEEQTRRALAAYMGMVSFMDDNVGRVVQALHDNGYGDNTRVIYTSDHGDNLGRDGLYGKSTMFEDSVGIPLIMTGQDVPKGEVVDTPVTLADFFPTIIHGVGEPQAPEDTRLPGNSLFEIANGARPDRTILSEYHATCSTGGIYMIRNGPYKYVHWVQHRPQLFNLETDPDEVQDLAGDPAYRNLLDECEARLRSVVDPEAMDRLAKHDQEQRLFEHGGRELILSGGTLGYTPAPGEEPDMG